MSQVLAAECIGKSFRRQRVLSSASLRAVAGELRVLLGRNGVGKSTLLKIAAGCLDPDSGSLQFAGRSYLSARLCGLAAKGLFYLPEYDLFSRSFTVRRQLQMIRQRFNGRDPEEGAVLMGIDTHLDKRPDQLSGGERRRAELAAAFVRKPLCLLADEPYRGLVPLEAERLTSGFAALAADGVAVVVAGHEVSTLLGAADHVTWCTSGTTYELGPPQTAINNETFRREYLGSA
ncbi:MAG TPA: ATP-binding cassette domain-containing protein [Gemmatimonadaceae bacterium]|nr:ATP-binding cassette domain-containing protein [Gemmatimonadaceae bacterium]